MQTVETIDEDMAPLGKRQALVTALGRAIVRGEYRVGEKLRQEEIAARFNVSPTPVREALRVLEMQGMVVHEPNRGVRVADFGGTGEQFYRLRGALESLAVETAVPRMTADGIGQMNQALADMDGAVKAGADESLRNAHRRFHQSIYDACDFPALVQIIQAVWLRFPWESLLYSSSRLPSVQDHQRIATLVADRDEKGAAEALQAHLETVRQDIVAHAELAGGPVEAGRAAAVVELGHGPEEEGDD